MGSGSVGFRLCGALGFLAGTFLCEWEVAYIDGTRRTFPNPGYDVVQIHGDLG